MYAEAVSTKRTERQLNNLPQHRSMRRSFTALSSVHYNKRHIGGASASSVTQPYGQIPLGRPDQTPTKSGKVRSGLRQVRGSCLVIDLFIQSRHVRILSVGLVESRTKSSGPCSGI